MEMNTRLQVEHPVTEAITGLDLVELQLRVAAGEPLAIAQADVVFTGHAIEARVYAEDPMAEFLPTGGRVQVLREPAGRRPRRQRAAARAARSSDYDPMLAKVIAWAPDRDAAHRPAAPLARRDRRARRHDQPRVLAPAARPAPGAPRRRWTPS